jgi:hypothetical protein
VVPRFSRTSSARLKEAQEPHGLVHVYRTRSFYAMFCNWTPRGWSAEPTDGGRRSTRGVMGHRQPVRVVQFTIPT